MNLYNYNLIKIKGIFKLSENISLGNIYSNNKIVKSSYFFKIELTEIKTTRREEKKNKN